MARYQLILAYDGTQFTGSQRQAKSRTVQGELEKALGGLGWSGRSVIMAGRTDTGVHATGQVAAFDLDWAHKPEHLLKALNAELPPDLVIKELREVEAVFHPRFDATSRRYVYRLFCGTIRDPMRERYAWRAWPEIDEGMLTKVSRLFVGTYDFSAFGSPTTPRGGTVRTVTKSEWERLEGEWQFEVQADAFLYRMVRRMVFVQVSVAQGKLTLEDVRNALSKKQTKLLAGLAPAHGLALVEVTYGSNGLN